MRQEKEDLMLISKDEYQALAKEGDQNRLFENDEDRQRCRLQRLGRNRIRRRDGSVQRRQVDEKVA